MSQNLSPRWIPNYRLVINLGATYTPGAITQVDFINPTDDVLVIEPPMRIAFEAQKSIYGALNKMRIRIYDLNEGHRVKLAKDLASDPGISDTDYIQLILSVGYEGGMLQQIFKGSLHVGRSSKEGTSIVTELESIDGGFDLFNAQSSRVVLPGIDPVRAAIADTAHIIPGQIRTGKPPARPVVLVGKTLEQIDDLLGPGDTWYIDDEQLYVITADQACNFVQGVGSIPTVDFLPVVSADTGLLGVPTRESMKVTARTLMNPSVKIGHMFHLVSSIAPHLTGDYRADTIEYRGDYWGNEWTQTVTGFTGNFKPVL